MRAVLMTAAGGPEVLEVGELPEPEITGQRDVGVRAARGRGWSSTSRRRAPPGRARHGSTAGGHPQSAASPAGYSRSHLVLLNFHLRLSVILNRILGSIS